VSSIATCARVSCTDIGGSLRRGQFSLGAAGRRSARGLPCDKTGRDNRIRKQPDGAAFGLQMARSFSPNVVPSTRRTIMNNKIASLLAAASVALGAAIATPALANYSYCSENPSAVKCPGNFDVTRESFYTAPQHHRSPSHAMNRPAHHQG
jgi:hypothetical protein